MKIISNYEYDMLSKANCFRTEYENIKDTNLKIIKKNIELEKK